MSNSWTGQSKTEKMVVNVLIVVMCAMWILPTLGLFVTSFRTREASSISGWWTVLSDIKALSLDNYVRILSPKSVMLESGRGGGLLESFFNSLAVTIPSVIIPILLAAFSAYGFAWMRFKGRRLLFVILVGLLVVPLQLSLIPILRDYQRLGINGTYLGIWLAHTGFGLPLAIYIMYNYISEIPYSIMESAFVDGASHLKVFVHLILPLSMPVIASFAILQFLWVWNDLLVAMVFLSGSGQGNEVLTQRLLNLVGSRGQDWHLLTSGAFVSMILPLTIFFTLQRFLVRGLLGGAVKG